MASKIHYLTLAIVLSPLFGAFLAGFLGKTLGPQGSHRVTIAGLGISFFLSLFIFKWMVLDGLPAYNGTLYTWALVGDYQFHLGFLIDQLTSIMLLVVTFVSLLVHIYTIGYMADDPGYQRFFSFISLFTFFMLMLVTSNNFLQLFFGWEGVGLASYLLISFWFKRESAILGGMKAFLVNRVGDIGFLLGIAAVLFYFGSLDYSVVFAKAPALKNTVVTIFPGTHWSTLSVICLLLFTGAMGKSAQVPLHVWLPESMEGPTPISALIHAATMVTAGVFMVARLSPMYELSITALSFILIIGATGALFLGILAVVQHDIKRVVAYSTLSQLGYMMTALGASAFAAGIFHLTTHACFKALLFLAAGSVIIAMHHEKDMRNMGGLKKYMPITYYCFLIGSLSMCAIPPLSGFYSKDIIIEAVRQTHIPGAIYAYYCVLIGAFVTPLYSFRALFLTFHTSERMDEHTKKGLRESPWVVTLPLILLAIPSVIIGAIMIHPTLFAAKGWLSNSIYVEPKLDVLKIIGREYKGLTHMALHAFTGLPFWFSIAGIVTAWLGYIKFPAIPGIIANRLTMLHKILLYKYGFDAFNNLVFVRGGRLVAYVFSDFGDIKIIDGFFVNGAGKSIKGIAAKVRNIQSGYLYHYAFGMVVALVAFLSWLLFG